MHFIPIPVNSLSLVNKLESAPIKEFREELSDMFRREIFYNILFPFAIIEYEKRWLRLTRSLTKPLKTLSSINNAQKLGRLK